MNRTLAMIFVLMATLILSAAVWAQNDPIGKTDTVTLVVETIQPGKWVITTHVWNDEDLGGVDIPIKYTAGVATLKVDSVAYSGTRMEKFAKTYEQIDTTNQMMHFGGFPYMAPNQPPMPPGNGEMARVYISVTGDKKPSAFAVDTTTMKPNNSLMLVDKDAKIIKPVLKIVYADKQKKEEAEKKK